MLRLILIMTITNFLFCESGKDMKKNENENVKVTAVDRLSEKDTINTIVNSQVEDNKSCHKLLEKFPDFKKIIDNINASNEAYAKELEKKIKDGKNDNQINEIAILAQESIDLSSYINPSLLTQSKSKELNYKVRDSILKEIAKELKKIENKKIKIKIAAKTINIENGILSSGIIINNIDDKEHILVTRKDSGNVFIIGPQSIMAWPGDTNNIIDVIRPEDGPWEVEAKIFLSSEEIIPANAISTLPEYFNYRSYSFFKIKNKVNAGWIFSDSCTYVEKGDTEYIDNMKSFYQSGMVSYYHGCWKEKDVFNVPGVDGEKYTAAGKINILDFKKNIRIETRAIDEDYEYDFVFDMYWTKKVKHFIQNEEMFFVYYPKLYRYSSNTDWTSLKHDSLEYSVKPWMLNDYTKIKIIALTSINGVKIEYNEMNNESKK